MSKGLCSDDLWGKYAGTCQSQPGRVDPEPKTAFRNHLVDSAKRCKMAKPAEGVSASFHLLAPSEALGRRRGLGADLGSVRGTINAAASLGLERVLRRWLLLPGEEGCAGEHLGSCQSPVALSHETCYR